ncbi:hypothetical protein [Halopelagius longus]|nr:hypothetical protein [Halopelagius longus]RDI71975.1 hypothetical protein DWB78_09715 [Halopelagius longus]
MSDGLPDVPEWIDEKIDVNERRETQDHHIVDAIQTAPRPFVSVKYLMNKLGMSRQGVKDRLDLLEEIDVVSSCQGANGRVYWVTNQVSKWPVPPDVEVGPKKSDETTVSEFISQTHVQLAVIALFIGVGGSFLITVFLTSTALSVEIPYEVMDGIVLLGFLSSLFSVLFMFVAGVYWLFDRVQRHESPGLGS